MSDRGDIREQPSIPEDPLRLNFEHLCLAVAVVALTVAVGALAVQVATQHDLLRGAYSVLAALIVCGVVGFSATLVLRELAAVKALLLEERVARRQRQGGDVRLVRTAASAGEPHRSRRGGDRVNYWRVYSDVLEDLGGLDGRGPED